MQYRQFGQLDWKASALGFGCMRLPLVEQDSSQIDEPEATRMLHYAIDHGVNYLDTAYPYHGGNSEPLVGRALGEGYRQRVRLATKMPCWLVETTGDFDKYLNEQLQRLMTDHIDFYLLHGLNRDRWHHVRDLDVLRWAEKAIADGRIGHLGFSFHDEYEVFREIVDAYEQWTFCQIQYNYVDVDRQAGTKGLEYAASKGLAVVIMEPLLGGGLTDPPESIRQLWDSGPAQRTPVDWALQWLWDKPEVSVVLSGMSTMQQVEENIDSAAASRIRALSSEELQLVARVRETYLDLCPIACTKCEYCLPCKNELNIPRLFELYNRAKMYNVPGWARWHYSELPEDKRADKCEACGQCEELCPQQLAISENMVRVHEFLGKKKG